MLPGITGIIAGLSSLPFDIEFGSRTGLSGPGTTYNFTGVSWLKPEDATRRIWIGVHWADLSSAGTDSISSATIGGVAATIHVQRTASDGSAQSLGTGIISAIVPTGASGTVTINFSSSTEACVIGSYASVSDGGVHATASNFANSDPSSPVVATNTINVVDNGATISAFCSSEGTNSVSWANAAETYDAKFLTNSDSGALAEGLGAQIGRVITATQTLASPPEGYAIVSVSIAPAV